MSISIESFGVEWGIGFIEFLFDLLQTVLKHPFDSVFIINQIETDDIILPNPVQQFRTGNFRLKKGFDRLAEMLADGILLLLFFQAFECGVFITSFAFRIRGSCSENCKASSRVFCQRIISPRVREKQESKSVAFGLQVSGEYSYVSDNVRLVGREQRRHADAVGHCLHLGLRGAMLKSVGGV